MVNISGLKKAEVLLALWNDSKIQEISFLGFTPMTIEKAEEEIKNNTNEKGEIYVDYCCGKVIKCDITGSEFKPRLYDRDLGEGAAQYAIEKLYESKGYHFTKMYSQGNVLDLVNTRYIDINEDRPIYRIILEEGKGICVIGLKPELVTVDLGAFFSQRFLGEGTKAIIKAASSNHFDVELEGITESDAFCMYNDLLTEINKDSRTIV